MIASATLIFLCTWLLSSALTLAVRRIAPRFGLTDHPDGRRKLHQRPIPLGGGIAVYLATAIVLGTLLLVPNRWQADFLQFQTGLWPLLAAGAVIVVVGLLDDRVGLRGRHKLIGQCVAISILVPFGVNIQRVGILGQEIELGTLGIPFTCFWLLGAINSINLLDGIDGLATMLGLILVTTFAVMAVMTGHPTVALIALIFAAALMGFAWFNLPPASIFLGDAGSMLIGLVLGTLAIHSFLKGPGTVLMAAPLAVWTIPIFDSLAAILRRKLTGRSIYTTDRGHLHHQLLTRLGSNRKVLVLVTVCCALMSSAALFSVFLKNDLFALLAGVALVAIFVATGMFGRAEVRLVFSRIKTFSRSFLTIPNNGCPRVSESAIHMQGSAQWNKLWDVLTESADRLSIHHMQLDLNLPLLHEGFTATWERQSQDHATESWRIETPLIIASQLVGRLRVSGHAGAPSHRQDISQLLEVLESCESYMQSIIEEKAKADTIALHARPGIHHPHAKKPFAARVAK